MALCLEAMLEQFQGGPPFVWQMQARVQQIVRRGQIVFTGLFISDERKVLHVGVSVIDKVVEYHDLEVPFQVYRVSGHVSANQVADFFV